LAVFPGAALLGHKPVAYAEKVLHVLEGIQGVTIGKTKYYDGQVVDIIVGDLVAVTRSKPVTYNAVWRVVSIITIGSKPSQAIRGQFPRGGISFVCCTPDMTIGTHTIVAACMIQSVTDSGKDWDDALAASADGVGVEWLKETDKSLRNLMIPDKKKKKPVTRKKGSSRTENSARSGIQGGGERREEKKAMEVEDVDEDGDDGDDDDDDDDDDDENAAENEDDEEDEEDEEVPARRQKRERSTTRVKKEKSEEKKRDTDSPSSATNAGAGSEEEEEKDQDSRKRRKEKKRSEEKKKKKKKKKKKRRETSSEDSSSSSSSTATHASPVKLTKSQRDTAHHRDIMRNGYANAANRSNYAPQFDGGDESSSSSSSAAPESQSTLMMREWRRSKLLVDAAQYTAGEMSEKPKKSKKSKKSKKRKRSKKKGKKRTH
jgi:hypothetical protein